MQYNSGHEVTHTEAFELLPWLVNDTLSAEEQAAVEQHIDRCPACRHELDEQQNMQDLVRESSLVPLPTSRSFNQLLSRIDASGSGTVRSRHVGRRRYLIAATLAAVSMAALLMVVVVDQPAPRGEFVTLTESSAQGGSGPTLHVVFESGISEADMRDVLLAVDGEIVSGPTPEGVYTIGVAGHSDRSNDFGRMLRELRADPRVHLAERNFQSSVE